jgi:hypothetical protein
MSVAVLHTEMSTGVPTNCKANALVCARYDGYTRLGCHLDCWKRRQQKDEDILQRMTGVGDCCCFTNADKRASSKRRIVVQASGVLLLGLDYDVV